MKIKGKDLFHFGRSWDNIVCWKKDDKGNNHMYVITHKTLEEILKKHDYIPIKKITATHLKLEENDNK